MLRIIFLFALLQLACACRTSAAKFNLAEDTFTDKFHLNISVHETSHLDFEDASGSSYLAMSIPFEPINELFKEISIAVPEKLKNRGEAHITIITPPEFEVLKIFLPMSRLKDLARNNSVQNSKFQYECLGRSQKSGSLETLSTYYIVIQSQDLIQLRRLIESEFISKGGRPGGFSAIEFQPHITVGFTERDLHIQDGAIKDRSSCIGELIQVNH